jgi:hypothetical protein
MTDASSGASQGLLGVFGHARFGGLAWVPTGLTRKARSGRLLAPYRCQPLPFDFGIPRAQAPIRLLTNWAGDNAFVHRMYTTMRGRSSTATRRSTGGR